MYWRMPRRSVSFIAILRLDGKTGELPQVRFVDQRSTPLAEQPGPALERRPIGLDRGAGPQIGHRGFENLLVGQIVWDKNALARVADHENQPSQHGGGDLKGRCVLTLDQLTRLVDAQLRAGPPTVQTVSH